MRNKLTVFRARNGWSQQFLAQRLGVTRQTIISIERGRFDPSLPLAFRLAQEFSCRIEDLFEPDRDEPQPTGAPG